MREDEARDEEFAESLRSRRPAPSRKFAFGLRERLLTQRARATRPEHFWALVAAYGCSGLVLLALAALGATGGGPFGS